jgi:hypothetical protein
MLKEAKVVTVPIVVGMLDPKRLKSIQSSNITGISAIKSKSPFKNAPSTYSHSNLGRVTNSDGSGEL